MRIIFICVTALLLAGCAGSSPGFGDFGGAPARPKTIVVTDFVFAGEVVAVDRSFTARLERKIGTFPTFERKQRTNERVNDEIVATVVASLREAGFEAQPGTEESVSLKDEGVLLSGRLRPADAAAAKNNQSGFGGGRGGVVADMTIVRLAGGGKRQLLAFAAEGAKRPAATPPKLAASRNAGIAAALAANNAAPEKLSPDVEAQARSLGRAIADKVLSFAQEQKWLTKGEGAEAAPADEEKPVKLPPARPEKKPAKKPAAAPDADPDAPPPD